MEKKLMQTKVIRKRFLSSTLTTPLVATVVLAVAGVTVVSKQQTIRTDVGESKKTIKTMGKNPNLLTVKVPGQEMEVDSQTGQVAALTQEEAQKLAVGIKQLVNQSTEGLVQVQHSDGSVSVNLEGRFQSVTVARVNKDGSISQSCLDNPKAAAKFFGIDPKLVEGPSKASSMKTRKSPAGIARGK